MNKRLWLILGLAFILRVWGIWFGPYHPDEPMVINQALSFGAGNPFSFAYYYYPPFFHYILFLMYALFYVLGWVIGPFRNFDNFLFLVLIKQLPFYFIGRFIVAFIGTATVVPVYLIAKKIRSEKAALLAALFMACMYLNVKNSHYCTVDVPMTFMVILCYVYVLKIVQDGCIKNYILAGIISGLAIATKYNAGTLIPCIMIASLTHFSNKEDRLKNIQRLIVSFACSAVAFLIFCSYCVWDYPNFAKAMKVLCDVGKNTNVSTWYHFKVNLYYGLGLPLEFLAILGFVYLIFKERKTGIILAAFPLLFFLGLARVGQPFDRYVLPVVPFFAISAGIFSYDLLAGSPAKFKFKKALYVIVVIFIIISPLIKSLYMDHLLSKPDIRDLAEAWVYKNILPGSKIAIDNPEYSPHLFPTKEQLKQKSGYLADGMGRDVKKKRLKLLINLQRYPPKNYEVYYLGELRGEFSLHTPAIPYSKNSILENSIEYIITSDIDIEHNKDFYDSLRKELTLIKEFSPFKEKVGARYSRYPYSHIPLDNTLFSLQYNGVRIKIFKVGKE